MLLLSQNQVLRILTVTIYIIPAAACTGFAWKWRMSTGLNESQSVRKCIKPWPTPGETLRALGWVWRAPSFDVEEKEIAATEVVGLEFR